jgi:hypothetical protein
MKKWRWSIPMRPKTRVLLTLIGLAFLDTIIPIPIVACILIYVVLQRPTWFTDMVRDVYGPWHG